MLILKERILTKVKKNLISKLHSRKFFDVYFIYLLQLKALNKLEYTAKSIFRLKKFSDLIPLKLLAEGYYYISTTQNNEKVKVPDLNIYAFDDAIIHSRSSTIINGKNLYYESINDNERFNESYVISHTKKNALIDLKHLEKIEEGFFLGGNGSFNWYHWMIEILPKMMYFNEVPTSTILVDESCKSIPSMTDSLKIFTDKLAVKIVYLDKNKSYKVKKLYHINEINKLMYNELDATVNKKPIFYYREKNLQQYREMFIKNSPLRISTADKIYLQRKNTHRIAENEPDILKLLQNQNFEAIDLTNLTLSEQINIFENAKIIVGTTGAAFTNLLFCKPNAYAIIFMPDNFKNYNFYQELGLMMNLKIKYLYYENGTEAHDKSNFRINENKLNDLRNHYEDTPLSKF